MLYNSNLRFAYSSIRPCVEEKISRINEGLPTKRVLVTRDLVVTNSRAFRSTLADVNDDQLEIDLATGVRLERVPSQVLSPERLETYPTDFKKVKTDPKTDTKTDTKN